ncbi:protein phosphatase 1G-like isoform X2 [Branchiostoma floridae x Branchiostoma belcheri]
MGAYLSEPKLDKDSSDGGTARLSYGVSAMQGWRISMEDAHNCIPEFDEKTALFAVYDGHGGAEVAEYCAKYLPEHLQQLQLYKDGNLRDALQEGFLSFDERLTQEEVINELKQLAGLSEDEQNEQETTDDPEDEASLLKQEADMSIEEILARYGKAQNKATAALRKKNKFQSPLVRKTQSKLGPGNCTENGEVAEGSEAAEGNCSSKVEKSSSAAAAAASSRPEVSEASSTSFTKAEKSSSEPRDSSTTSENEAKPKTTTAANGEGDSCSSSHTTTAEDSAVGSSCAGSSSSEIGAGDAAACSNSGPCSSSSVAKGQGSSSEGEGSSLGQGSSSGAGSSSGQEATEDNGCSSVSSSTGGKGKGKGKKSSPAGEAGGSGSDSAPGGSRAPPDSSEEEEEESEEDSDDMFDEDDSEEDSDDLDDDEDEDGEEEEEEDGDEGPIIFSDKEQPGSDSGTTAVVALLSQEKLYVGNAGDSRCVLCRAGRAIDMSIDHKPEDDEERDRILKAGGKVTQDGRVNGGLNLSRAIGDHCYKRNEDLPLKDQMITSLPDVRTIDMQQDDEFMVLACDGIWNVLTSQQVVDFVRNRLAEETPDGGKRTLSSICEELLDACVKPDTSGSETLFDLCLAPDTTGDGTGCDNMTCIIVKLHGNSQSATAKRPLENVEEASQAKKPRPDEPDTSSG